LVPTTESSVEPARDLGEPRIPRQRLPYAKEARPERRVPARQKPSAARWVLPGVAATVCAATQLWLLVVPMLNGGSGTYAAAVTDCVPQRDLYEVQVGMTRQAVLNTFSSAGHIEEYTPRQSLAVVHRSCAATAPWTRLLWISYVWEQGEWRVAGLHKGLGIVDPP
jgi:hypothetical protein